MSVRFTCMFLLLIVCIVPASIAFAHTLPLVAREGKNITVTKELALYRTADDSTDISTILNDEAGGRIVFRHIQKTSFGFTRDTFWLKFGIAIRESSACRWLLELNYPLIDSVNFYIVSRGRVLHREDIRDTAPFRARAIPNRTPLFPLNTSTGNTFDIYLKLKTGGTMRFPLILWPVHSFIHNKTIRNTYSGMYYGFLLMLFIFIVILFFNQQWNTYIYFAFFILLASLFHAIQDGVLFELVMPEHTTWKFHAYIASGSVALLSLSMFIYNFLLLKSHGSYFRWMYSALALMGFLVIAISYIFETYISIRIFAIFGILCMPPNLLAGIVTAYRGHRSGLFLLTAVSFFVTGVVIFSLRGYGVLPTNPVTLYAKEAGILMLALITTLAIADNLKTFRIQSITDGLTGLINTRHFYTIAKYEIDRNRRHNSNLSLLMLDIDFFKAINDTYGHAAGDTMLKAFSNGVKVMLRGIDTVARLGGEEFACLLPDTDINGAEQVADRIRRGIEDMTVVYNRNELRVTVSIGIATLDREHDDIVRLLDKADKALYGAKNSGRNRVCRYG